MKFPLAFGGTWSYDAYTDSLDLSQLTPERVAWGLAHVNRFCGAAGSYSVAEHSAILAGTTKGRESVLAALLHDVDECLGLADAHGWLKKRFCPDLKAFATRLKDEAWRVLVGGQLPGWESVKTFDGWLGDWEAKCFGFPNGWSLAGVLPEPRCLPPLEAYDLWLKTWRTA